MTSTALAPTTPRGRAAVPPKKRASAEIALVPPRLPARRGGRNRIEVLVQEGVGLLRSYAKVETSKTIILRELARVVVELRSNFATEDGRTDWAGRSSQYRDAVATIYREAGLPPDSMDTVQASLRYHVGNVLRAVAPPEELEDLGLRTATPRERVKETRDRTAALARASVALSGSGNVRADAVRMIVGADVLLGKVDEDALQEVPEERLAELAEVVEAMAQRVSALRSALRRRTRPRRR